MARGADTYRIMKHHTAGIHHVTGICGDPQRNIDFYAGLLGLRLVKCAVNFDDPTTYHISYGDDVGRPGTILSFHSWAWMHRGRQGTGQAAVVSLAIAPTSFGFWTDRLAEGNVRFDGPFDRFDEMAILFRDPDGLLLELVADPDVQGMRGWRDSPVGGSEAIRGLHSVTLWEKGFEATAGLLVEALGFKETYRDGSRFRFETRMGGLGSKVDIRSMPEYWAGIEGRGTVHHVAFRMPDDQTELESREEIARRNLDPTPVLDRQYYHSFFFREPGGANFAVSTDTPGFLVDETIEELGTRLALPPWIEPDREEVEEALPAISQGESGEE